MKTLNRVGAVLAVVFVVVATGSAAVAQSKIDVSGGWNVDVDVAGNTGAPVFTFKQDGEKLSGRYKGRFGEAEVSGTVHGDEITFSLEAQGAKIVYTGTVKKNTMAGRLAFGPDAG